jgi:hypothetical protein
MLGRNSYEPAELDHAKAAIAKEVAAYKKLANAAAVPALEAFEPLFFNSLVMTLDRFFVHRVRPVTGKDCNPLNEVERITESLLAGSVLEGVKVIKWIPDQTVLGLEIGDPIALTAAQFDKLAKAFFAELEARFL